jgi:hypothetical protein
MDLEATSEPQLHQPAEAVATIAWHAGSANPQAGEDQNDEFYLKIVRPELVGVRVLQWQMRLPRGRCQPATPHQGVNPQPAASSSHVLRRQAQGCRLRKLRRGGHDTLV